MRRIDAWFLKYPFYGARQQEADVRISMDGRGRCLDNIFIERVWRSLTYEALSLRELAEGFEAPTHHRPMDRLLHRRPRSTAATRLWICWTRRSAPVPTDSNTPARRPRPQEPGGI